MDGVGIDHFQYQQSHLNNHGHFSSQPLPSRPLRKRKADAAPENNERLSKRMSVLNLEDSGQKLYVPVENPHIPPTQAPPSDEPEKKPQHHGHRHPPKPTNTDDSPMQLDDSKYKVYIYNIDDELSSDNDDSDAESQLVFLPDIEKHLRDNRIPLHLRGPSPAEAAAADLASKQLVLYSVPSSISVPEEQDSVRKAIIEARERVREKQRVVNGVPATVQAPVDKLRLEGSSSFGDVPMDAEPLQTIVEEDPDAMDID